MAVVAQWLGNGLSEGPLTSDTAGEGDTSFFVAVPENCSVVNSGPRPPRARIGAGDGVYLSWGVNKLNHTFTECAVRMYAEFESWSAEPSVSFIQGFSGPAQWKLDIAGSTETHPGQVRLLNASNTLLADSGSDVVPLNTLVRIELVITAAGDMTAYVYLGDSTTALFTVNATGLTTPTFTALRVGNTAASVAGETWYMDDLMLSDTAELIGPWEVEGSAEAKWSLWEDGVEKPLTLAGVYNGTSIVNAVVDRETFSNSHLLIGAQVEPASLAQFQSDNATMGPWTVHRAFDSGGFPASFSTSAARWDVGRWATVYSCKPNLDDLASGTLDVAAQAFLLSIPEDHPTFVTIWHEADVKIKKGSAPWDASQYKAGWRRLFSIVRELNRPNIYTTLILGNYVFINPQSGATMEDLWPGNDESGKPYVDVLAFDGYTYEFEPPEVLWGPGVAFAKSKGVDWGIGEIGFSANVVDGAGAAEWMQQQADYCATTGTGRHGSAAYMCWFNSTVGGVPKCPSTFPETQIKSRSISKQYYRPYKEYVL